MPKQSMTFELPTNPSESLTIARQLVVERGWSVESLTSGRLVSRQAMRTTTWPVKIELLFAGAGAGSQVTANGKVGGWGPIQRRHLVRAMDELRASMEFQASTAPEPDAAAEQR
jgi:hypothetical protein